MERWIFRSRSSNCFGTDLDSKIELCRLTPPFGSSILAENVIVRGGNFRGFGGFPKPGLRHG